MIHAVFFKKTKDFCTRFKSRNLGKSKLLENLNKLVDQMISED